MRQEVGAFAVDLFGQSGVDLDAGEAHDLVLEAGKRLCSRGTF